jgi:thiol:disulfide interchange protein DsbD
MRIWLAGFVLSGLLLCGADVFQLEANLHQGEGGAGILTLRLGVPTDAYLYEAQLHLQLPEGVTAERGGGLQAVFKSADEGMVYSQSGDIIWRLENIKFPLQIDVAYQGCVAGLCYRPQQKSFTFQKFGEKVAGASSSLPAAPDADGGRRLQAWREFSAGRRVLGSASGYLDVAKFLDFLQQSHSGKAEAPEANLLARVFSRFGLLLAALLIIPLGLLLNLTPCVLPMIPINLSIIGASSVDAGRGRGLLLGSLYGLSMALVYGILGMIVVLTGSRFGAINSSPWFNLGIVIVFVFLALSMFDVFMLDFSRFRGGSGRSSKNWITAMLLGAISAVLAGACVAPVLIWVLLLATDLYAKGNLVGVFLPLLLGIGMALPWPLLGAGVSSLPKPGTWMERVKQALGVLILIFAAYYLHLSVSLFRLQAGQVSSEALPGWKSDLITAVELAKTERKPILIYFWGVTCKNCTIMKKTTLQDEEVKAELEKVIPVAFQADDGQDPLVAELLKQFQIIGMPTYVLLE